jgi:hypothetical protein
MESVQEGPMRSTPCNAETKAPHRNWDECWTKARIPGPGPENSSFMFKLMHKTLVTQERLSNTSPYCKFPGCPGTVKEDTLHAIPHCPCNNGVGVSIFSSIQSLVPNLQAQYAICLDLNVDDTRELPIVWALAVAWSSLWKLRQKQTRPQLYLLRAQIEARININDLPNIL